MSELKMSEKCKKIEPDTEINKILLENFTSEFRKGYVEIGEEKIVMPLPYKEIADLIENFEVRDTDIFLASHPKTGTTWTQEMMWMILNNLDYEGGKVNILERFPFLEMQCIFDYSTIVTKYPDFVAIPPVADSINVTKNFKGTPRLIKTHLPWCLLPKALREGTTKASIVYVARNPKDTCVSYYHHDRLLEGYNGNFEDFCKLFLAGRLNYGPYWTNILDYWERRFEPNVLFIKYEDMKRDLASVIRKVSDFLIRRPLSDQQISELEKHLSFESMKANPSVNYEHSLELNSRFIHNNSQGEKFMRSGTIGSYKVEMSPEVEKIFDEWTEKHTKDTNITF